MADKLIFANNASATLASTLLVGGLSAVLTAGQGAKFPSPAAGQYFKATLTDVSGNKEIVHATARSSDTITITRAQEGTTAREFPAGSLFEICVTKGVLEEMLQRNEYGLNKITEVTVTPPTDANYTLTEAEYSAHTINLNLVNWTTDRSIIVPNEDRKWDINNPSSTRSATIKTAAGSGKTVISGSERPLYCDGTNVLNPITAVSELGQLEVAGNSKGNVSRLVAEVPSNGTSAGYWFKFADVEMGNTAYATATLCVKVIGELGLYGALDATICISQGTTTFDLTRCDIRLDGFRSKSTPNAYAPMMAAVASNDALGQTVGLWIQAQVPYTEIHIFELARAQYPATLGVTYHASGSWQLAEPTGAFKIKTYSDSTGGRKLANVVDTSDLTADTILQPGETAICSWTSQTSKALRINTTNGGVYRISGYTDMGGPDAAISLNVNNTTYANQFNETFARIIGTATPQSAQQLGNSIQLAYGQRNTNAPMFFNGTLHVGSTGASANALKAYDGIGKALVAGVNEQRLYATEMNNNSTLWTSLGTLIFGNSCSGVVTIERIS